MLVLGIFLFKNYLVSDTTEIGETAPTIEGILVSGAPFTLAELRGKYVLVDFWGSWCGPCRKEFPALRKLYSQYTDKDFKDGDGFEIVSIALEKSAHKTVDIINSENLSWPYHIIDVSRIVLLSKYAQLYGVQEVPTKYLINPNGKIMGTNLSFDEMSRLLSSRLSN